MASIANDPNGRRRIQFVAADGSRKTIRLGKVSQRQAAATKAKIEDLASSTITGHAPNDETARWLAGLDKQLYTKLASVGLTKPRESTTLGAFTKAYIDSRVDVKVSTRTKMETIRGYLLGFFPADKPLRDFTLGDAQDFRLHLIAAGKAENTMRRAIGISRQFFKAALQRQLVTINPFEGIVATVRANPERFYFVTRDEADKVLDACPDAQWRLIFALARYGGLRCPSEVLSLTWDDVFWDAQRIRVPSPKTEHVGKASRIIPMFPELKPYLLEAFEQAEPGTVRVITRYRETSTNLRTALRRIIGRAGLEPWVKTFQNLRSTRQTELAEQFPAHVVCKWIGNSEPVAAEHYLQLTDRHFEQAVVSDGKAAQNAAQQAHARGRMDMNSPKADEAIDSIFAGVCSDIHRHAESDNTVSMGPPGLEPGTSSLSATRSSQLSYEPSIEREFRLANVV